MKLVTFERGRASRTGVVGSVREARRTAVLAGHLEPTPSRLEPTPNGRRLKNLIRGAGLLISLPWREATGV